MSPGSLSWWAPWVIPVGDAPIRNGLVVVADGRIAELHAAVSREDAAQEHGAEIFDECVIAPGFVNAHAHIEYAAYDGLVDGLSFPAWIADHIHRKQRLSVEHMRASADLGAQQALASGITCIGDASYSGEAAGAMVESGLRGRVYLEVFGVDERALDDCLERLDGLPSSPLVSLGVSPHAPYTVSEKLYRAVAATGLPWMTHLNESVDELEFVRQGTGDIADMLARAGLEVPRWGDMPIVAMGDILGGHTVCVHLAHLGEAEVESLASGGVPVAHCPRSNARLGCGRFDISRAERAGLQIGLGTDSPASAGPIDMFAEMRSAIEVHRTAGVSAEWPTAAQVLEYATVGAARALGYDDLGTIAVGAAADLVACSVPATTHPVETYVLTGGPSRTRAVAVNGSVVWRHDRNSVQAAESRAADARALLSLPVKRPVA